MAGQASHSPGCAALRGGATLDCRCVGVASGPWTTETRRHMTTLDDRPNSALLVDRRAGGRRRRGVQPRRRHRQHQHAWSTGPAPSRCRSSGCSTPTRACRAARDGWQYVPELHPPRRSRSCTSTTATRSRTRTSSRSSPARGSGRVVVTGAQTDACIRSTLHGALVRGYDATLVEDAHTTEDLRQWGVPVSPEQVIAHTNTYWSGPRHPAARATRRPRQRCASASTEAGTGTVSGSRRLQP